MNTVTEHIEYLIRNYDCVIVPRLGGFVAQHIPAYYDEQGHQYFPPRRYVVFNPDLNHNDGLLVSSVSRKEKIGYDAALKIVNDDVSAMTAQLKSEKSIALGHLGRFDYVEDKIIFWTNDSFVSSPEYYGLSPLNIMPVEVEEDSETEVKAGTKKKFDLKRKALYAARVAASVAVFIICGFLLSTPVIIDEEAVRYASLALPEVSMPERQNQVSGELFIACPSQEDGMATIASKQEQEGEAMLSLNLDDPYYLVVSALATRSQAEEYVSYTKGYNLQIVETPSGKFRIIAATGKSAADVMKYTHDKSFSKQFPDAWPCQK